MQHMNECCEYNKIESMVLRGKRGTEIRRTVNTGCEEHFPGACAQLATQLLVITVRVIKKSGLLFFAIYY